MKNLEKKLNKIMSEVDERTKYYGSHRFDLPQPPDTDLLAE